MKTILFLVRCFLVFNFIIAFHPPQWHEVNRVIAQKPAGNDTRGLVDTVGFAHTRQQIEAVVQLSEELEADTLEARRFTRPWIAGISPHDDYIYAGRVYVHLMRQVTAKRVVLFGVAHKAWKWKVENQLIFDAFNYWKGPYGPVLVSPLREEIIQRLKPEQYLISNTFHSEEHSLEALIPFLQYYNREVEIVPILVPYMKWGRMDSLASALAEALNKVIAEKQWVLGKDMAFLISTDCVHYGDEGWEGKNYAPFGADEAGYQQAVARDQELIHQHLIGPIQPQRLHSLLYRLVDEEDVHRYRITWCGRFSIPFGLDCLYYLMNLLPHPPLTGYLLRYGTSVDLGKLPIEKLGLGQTAPSSLHHWVGYCAIGYF
ncbi:MAG: AmmeMemoRadiSam system protein B [candidate division KSB1 bacterium]|nr:AmmeMemoRadiSam system protein B [candidate division KSB1 bacterium]